MILSKKNALILYALLTVVYICGMFIPLMENDSAQHATMAMRMMLHNDYWNIYVGVNDYLDKPHVHFWLAALSFKIFGIYDWAYRIPAIIFTIIGAVYTDKTAQFFYGKKVANIGALVFLSVQAIVLANHDVRTDAVLTGATIWAIYHFVIYLEFTRLKNVLIGFLALAIGFGTKGQLAVFVTGVIIGVHIIHQKKWSKVFSWKVLVGIVAYAFYISPILYAYYVQFDLHPEKVLYGESKVSGVRFILWDQCFNRLNAKGFQSTSPDYLFFFHTILWAFLPWSILFYRGVVFRLKQLFVLNKYASKRKEFLSSLGVLLVLLVISTSKFKLPHYLNSLFPLMAVLITGYLLRLHMECKKRVVNFWLKFQLVTLFGLFSFVVFICLWSFAVESYLFWGLLLLVLFGLMLMLCSENTNGIDRIIVSSVGFMILINLCLNLQFYPNLLRYQSGIVGAEILESKKVESSKVKLVDGVKSWSLNFYRQSILETVSLDAIDTETSKGDWLYLKASAYHQLKSKGVILDKEYELTHYRITRLTPAFLNPTTREESVSKRYLVKR